MINDPREYITTANFAAWGVFYETLRAHFASLDEAKIELLIEAANGNAAASPTNELEQEMIKFLKGKRLSDITLVMPPSESGSPQADLSIEAAARMSLDYESNKRVARAYWIDLQNGFGWQINASPELQDSAKTVNDRLAAILVLEPLNSGIEGLFAPPEPQAEPVTEPAPVYAGMTGLQPVPG